MGLLPNFLEAVIREHVHKPITGDVLLIGRQTIYASPLEALDLLKHCGSAIPEISPADIEIDHSTENRLRRWQGKHLISDAAFLRLLGIRHLKALDHTAYEGAEIIHDLRQPIPERLRGSADVVIDGSTLDNTFDPALTLKNMVDLLRPGGRLITVNMASNNREPYTIPSPLWYLDYFVMNGFLDCKVYVQLFFKGMDQPQKQNTFCINTDCFDDGSRIVRNFTSPYEMAVVAFAERGVDSRSSSSPTQQHYRGDDEWSVYRQNLARIKKSSRPHLCRSSSKMQFYRAPPGYLYVNNIWNAREPVDEMPTHRAAIRRLRARVRELSAPRPRLTRTQ